MFIHSDDTKFTLHDYPERAVYHALQRTRPLLRFWVNLKVLVWGRAAEGGRWAEYRWER